MEISEFAVELIKIEEKDNATENLQPYVMFQTIHFRCSSRSSHPEVFLQKGVLKTCRKFTPMPKCDFNKVALVFLKILEISKEKSCVRVPF